MNELHKELNVALETIGRQAEALGWKGYQRPAETQSFRDSQVAKQRAKDKKLKARKASKKARKRNR
jgi:hypothetical protein